MVSGDSSAVTSISNSSTAKNENLVGHIADGKQAISKDTDVDFSALGCFLFRGHWLCSHASDLLPLGFGKVRVHFDWSGFLCQCGHNILSHSQTPAPAPAGSKRFGETSFKLMNISIKHRQLQLLQMAVRP